jgi:acyl-CoA synthetase (AMP-forming)/AMP-acid ligase II
LGRSFPPKQEVKKSLRFLRSASSALPPDVLAQFEDKLGVPVIESYGISEASSQVTSNPLPPQKRLPGSVGLPFGCQVSIVENGLHQPALTSGEVAVRGPNVFKGYFRDEIETKKSFLDDWFLSGDLGQIDPHGYLFIKGRLKELINRAGEMISPREIDEVLGLYPGVELAAAVGVPDPLYGEEIVAFVTTRQGVNINPDELMTFCRQRLSPYKTPKSIYFTENLPKGPSGKIQRLKLVEVYRSLANQGKGLK